MRAGSIVVESRRNPEARPVVTLTMPGLAAYKHGLRSVPPGVPGGP